MSELAALRAATGTGAALMRLTDVGTIAAGAIADLCAFRGDTVAASLTSAQPTVVIQGGRVVRDRRVTAAR